MAEPVQPWHIDDVPVGLMLATERGQIQQVNQALCDMLGHERQALLALSLDHVFTPAARLLYHSYLLPLLKLHGELAELSLAVQTLLSNFDPEWVVSDRHRSFPRRSLSIF